MSKRKVPTNKQKIHVVSSRTLIHIAWRNMVSKKLRTFLTLFGIIIGIGAIFFLLSFGIGLQNLVTEQVIGNQSIKSVDISTPNSKLIKLDIASVEKIRNLPHVQKAGTQFSFPGSLKQKGSEVDTVAYGVDTNYLSLTDLSLTSGRLLNKADNKAILINQAARAAVGFKSDKDALNKQITLYIPLNGASPKQQSIENQYTVVGIIGSGSGSEVFVPSFLFEAAGVSVYTQVKLIADDSKNVSDLRRQIESYGFETMSPNDTIDQINQIFKFFNLILVGFGAIGMIVAVLGMFNTLTISLIERTKEIGLMMALGARNRDMSRLFMFEAALLSVVGASIGIFMAIISGAIVNVFMNGFAHRRGVKDSFNLFATPLWLILALIGFMLIVGFLVALFPAKRAKHINPIDALRRE
ncbi:MAG: ABC transporter permease [Patescibacteria group bacterium]